MLVGLLRLRFRMGDTFVLERVLWKQVRWLWFSPLWCSKFTDVIYVLVRKGLIWLFIAMLCEIPPTVRLSILSSLSSSPISIS
jgi:hypothetical protein